MYWPSPPYRYTGVAWARGPFYKYVQCIGKELCTDKSLTDRKIDRGSRYPCCADNETQVYLGQKSFVEYNKTGFMTAAYHPESVLKVQKV
jgi:hypothetical protein